MRTMLAEPGQPGGGRGISRTLGGGLVVVMGLFMGAGQASGQTSLADYDYENLSFRGFSLETGYLWPTRAVDTYSLGLRVDLGYLGPGLRIVPSVSYWSSSMKGSEVRELERKVEALVDESVDLGSIDWSDFVLGLDSHFVWSVPLDLLTFVGAGLSLHVMNGEGTAISGTFVEDLLDSVNPGFNVHAGLEYPVADQFRLYGLARYEIMEDLRYPELRVGAQIMLTEPAPGEGR